MFVKVFALSAALFIMMFESAQLSSPEWFEKERVVRNLVVMLPEYFESDGSQREVAEKFCESGRQTQGEWLENECIRLKLGHPKALELDEVKAEKLYAQAVKLANKLSAQNGYDTLFRIHRQIESGSLNAEESKTKEEAMTRYIWELIGLYDSILPGHFVKNIDELGIDLGGKSLDVNAAHAKVLDIEALKKGMHELFAEIPGWPKKGFFQGPKNLLNIHAIALKKGVQAAIPQLPGRRFNAA